MNNTLGIQEIVCSHIKKNQLPISDFASTANINKGIISKFLNIEQQSLPSITQLDALTEALGYQKGALYDIFVDDFQNYKFHWRRTKSVIAKFALEKRNDLIEKIGTSIKINESPNLIKQVSAFAEELYDSSFYEAAEVMFQTILRMEKKIGSKRFCVSLYRLFKIHEQSSDNHIYAMQLKPYLARLDPSFRLDALISSAKVFVIREEWQDVNYFIDELEQFSKLMYSKKIWEDEKFKPVRPLPYYYGQCFLFRGAYYEEGGKYDKALECIKQYENLSWMDGLDELGHVEVKKLSRFAYDNKLLIAIKTGSQDAIPDYVQSLNNTSQNNIIDGITTLIEAARKYKYSIDNILEYFHSYLPDWSQDVKEDSPFTTRNIARFTYQLSLYLLDRNRYNEGVEQCLRSMSIFINIKNQKGVLDAFIVFEIYRDYASSEQLEKFSRLIHNIKG